MAKWTVEKSHDVCSEIIWLVGTGDNHNSRQYAGSFSGAVFPDAEQRAEKLCAELNERDQPKWRVMHSDLTETWFSADRIAMARVWGPNHREVAEKIVAMMNAEEEPARAQG